MTTQNLQRTMLTLPPEVTEAFESMHDIDDRNGYITALRNRSWTLQSIAEATGMSRERVRQISNSNEVFPIPPRDFPLPYPPEKTTRAPRTYAEPTEGTLERLLELQPTAQKVRANSTKYRAEAEEYTKLVWHAHIVEGVSLYRLAKRLGVTHGALRFRLVRYGYKLAPVGAESKAYSPIKAENRAS